VDNADIVLSNTSIAVDRSGNVHIGYVSYIDYGASALMYVSNSSGAWVSSAVDSGRTTRQHASVAIDSADKVHISYVSGQHLMYMTNASGSWVTEIADSNGGWKPRITVDSSGKAHVVFTSSNDPHGSVLNYATNASGSWASEIVDNSAISPSIAVDSADKVHISYTTAIDYGWLFLDFYLKYATNASGSWLSEIVDSEAGADTSIAVDSADKVHIAYSEFVPYSYGDFYYNLKYATNASGSWVTETVDKYGIQDISISADSGGNAHIVYYYYSFNSYEPAPYSDVRYATNASGSWVTQILDDSGDMNPPAKPSITVDSSDNVHVAYSYDFQDGYAYADRDLKYATNAPGLWEFETVVRDGLPTSMAMDSLDYVYIVYYDRLRYDLRYATNKPLPRISVTDSVEPADDLLIPFGEIRGGRQSRQTATVTNTGKADLAISAAYLTGRDPEQFYIRKDDCSDTAIAPSGTCTIEVVFNPAEAGVFSAGLGIDSNDPDTPVIYVKLTGSAVVKREKGRKRY